MNKTKAIKLSDVMEGALNSLVYCPAEKISDVQGLALRRRGLAEWNGQQWESTVKGDYVIHGWSYDKEC